MNNIKTAIIILSMFLAQPLQAASDIYFGLTLLNTDTNSKFKNQYIWVEDGLIKEIGKGRPRSYSDDTTLHDRNGQFAMAGLIDSHAHPTFGPFYLGKEDGKTFVGVSQNEDMARHNAGLLLGHGVTTIRDPGSDTKGLRTFQKDIKSGLFPGPDTLRAGSIIDASGTFIKGLTADRSQSTIGDVIAGQVEEGVDYIKLYMGLSPDELKEGIEAAHNLGVKAVVDLGDVSWTTVSNLGIDSIAHAFPKSPDLLPENVRQKYMETRRGGKLIFIDWFELVDLDGAEVSEAIEAMRKNKVHFDATLTPWYLGFWNDMPEVVNANDTLIHPASLENFKTLFAFNRGWTEDDYARAKAIWPKVLKLTKMVYDAGVPMTIGTDHGNYMTSPGKSLHQEMALHHDAGIENWDILKMATSRAADILELGDKTGRLKAGLEADIIFMTQDSSIDISNISSIEAVMTNGVLYSSMGLVRP